MGVVYKYLGYVVNGDYWFGSVNFLTNNHVASNNAVTKWVDEIGTISYAHFIQEISKVD